MAEATNVNLNSGPRKYRRIPAVVEAMPLFYNNAELVAEWCDGIAFYSIDEDTNIHTVTVSVPSAKSTLCAVEGDFVVKNKLNQVYVMPSSIFFKRYELK